MNTISWAAACAATMIACPAHGAVQQVQVTGAKYDQRRQETAGTIVIAREELVRHGDRTLADALVRVPGITIGSGGIRMRGLGNGYTQILLDGVAAPAGFSLESLSPELIERIDIVKTASAELGLQGIAGTINIVMKKSAARSRDSFKAGLDRQRGQHSPSVSGQFAFKGETLSSSLGLTLGRTRVLSSSMDHEVTRTATPPTFTERLNARHEVNANNTLNVVPRMTGKFGAGDLTVRGLINLHRRQARGEGHETMLAGDASAIPHGALAFFTSADNLHLGVDWTQDLASGAKLELAAGAEASRRGSGFTYHALPVAGAEATAVDSQVDEDTFHARAKYRVTLAGAHQLVAGGEHHRTTRAHTRDGNDIAPLGQWRFDRYDGTVTRSSLYVQDDWQGKDGWSMSAGLRADLLASDVVQSQQRRGVLGPVLQALYKPGPGAQLRLGLTRTYKAPPMYALIPRRYKVDNNNNPSNPDTQGNPELRPEVAWGLDAGYEHYLGKQAMFSVSAFVRRIDDVTVRRLTRDQIGWVIDQTNNGRADASGVLLEAKSPLRQWWPGGPDMDIRASAARNWSRIHAVSGPHNRLDEQEPANANLAVDYRPADMPLTVSANFNYRAGSTVRWSALVASSKAAARVLDLHAVWKLADGMRLRAGVLNLLGQDNVTRIHYSDDNIDTRTSVAFKASPTLRLGMELDLP